MNWANLSDPDRRIADIVRSCPLISTDDIAGILDRRESGVSACLRRLKAGGIVNSIAVGWRRQQRERFYLSSQAQDETGLAGATWHQPGCLTRLMERISSVEDLYEATAQLKGLGALKDFQWLDGVSLDAAVRFEAGWVALFRVGTLPAESDIAKTVTNLGRDLVALAAEDPHPRPALLYFVTADLWESELVNNVVRLYEIEDWAQIYCVQDGSWEGQIARLNSRGWIHQPIYQRRDTWRAWERGVNRSLCTRQGIRRPVNILRNVQTSVESQVGKDVGGRLVRRLSRIVASVEETERAAELIRAQVANLSELEQVGDAAKILLRVAGALENPDAAKNIAIVITTAAEWPGISTDMLRLVLGETRKGRKAQNICIRLGDLGVLVSWRVGGKQRHALSSKWVKILADMDRISEKTMTSRLQLGKWPDPEGKQIHEYGLMDVVQDFLQSRLPVANGWRYWEEMEGEEGAIDPDAMVFFQNGPLGPGWYYVEYERSAIARSAIARKLNGYASPHRRDDRPLLVICRHEDAEKNFQAVGLEKKINLITTTIERRKRHGAVGNTECWSHFGQKVMLPGWQDQSRQQPEPVDETTEVQIIDRGHTRH
ncbi:MAG: hypothetical protein OXE17_02890 [Chloroflexi bacterium]|nr:hypothetical protein [Chloroflexota bacterium]